MNSHELTRACSKLEQLAKTLQSDAEIPVILDTLDKLPDLFSATNRSPSQADLSKLHTAELSDLRMSFGKLQQSLVQVEHRLQREHQSILLQLHELSAQWEWAQLSRQSG